MSTLGNKAVDLILRWPFRGCCGYSYEQRWWWERLIFGIDASLNAAISAGENRGGVLPQLE